MTARNLTVSVYGSGSIGSRVVGLLEARAGIDVRGPFKRHERSLALQSGTDVVVIATASFLSSIAADVHDAVGSASNVITTAEQAAFPFVADPTLAREIDEFARAKNVTVLGAGINPGLAFDALVLTLCGSVSSVDSIRVSRVVDLSGWGVTVLRQLGVGYDRTDFSQAVDDGRVTGHIGWDESASIVASALDVEISNTEVEFEPYFAADRVATPAMTIEAGESVGFRQRFVTKSADREWYEAVFVGHVDLAAADLVPGNEIHVEGTEPMHVAFDGFNPQSGTAAVIANSVRRVVEADPGWTTVAHLPPAAPGR